MLFRSYEGDDALAFVLSLNLQRRQLSVSQLAFVALEIEKYEATQATLRQKASQFGGGTNATTVDRSGKARDKAAAAVGTSARYVQDAKKIEATEPELAAEVISGKKTITQAMREIKETAREQRGEVAVSAAARTAQCTRDSAPSLMHIRFPKA